MCHPEETHTSKPPSVKVTLCRNITSCIRSLVFRQAFCIICCVSPSCCRQTTPPTSWPKRSWTYWPVWWAAWRWRTCRSLERASESTCSAPTRRRRRRESCCFPGALVSNGKRGQDWDDTPCTLMPFIPLTSCWILLFLHVFSLQFFMILVVPLFPWSELVLYDHFCHFISFTLLPA